MVPYAFFSLPKNVRKVERCKWWQIIQNNEIEGSKTSIKIDEKEISQQAGFVNSETGTSIIAPP